MDDNDYFSLKCLQYVHQSLHKRPRICKSETFIKKVTQEQISGYYVLSTQIIAK